MIYRLPLLKARNELDSWVSREAAFLANNWVLLFSAFFVLFATMFPTLSRGDRRRAPDGRPAVLQHVDDAGRAGPAAAHRHRAAAGLAQVDAGATCAQQFLWPIAVGVVAGRVGRRARDPGLELGHLLRAVRRSSSARSRRSSSAARRCGGDYRHRSLHGDGRAGRPQQAALRRLHRARRHRADVPWLRRRRASSRDEQALLKPGQQVTVGRYVLRLDAHPRHRRRARSRWSPATSRCSTRRPASSAQMYPAQVVLPQARPTSRRPKSPSGASLAEDLYIVLAGFELGEQSASVEIHVNELVNWIWLGFGLLALGTGIALLPERVFAFAQRACGAEAATATLLLLSLLLAPARRCGADQGGHADRAVGSSKRDLANEIMCTCGCRLPAGTCGMMNCQGKASQLAKIDDAGVGREDARARSSTLRAATSAARTSWRAPIDEGFIRLLAAAVHLAGLSGAGRRVDLARRWSRRGNSTTPAMAGAAAIGCRAAATSSTMSSATSTDPGLQARGSCSSGRHAAPPPPSCSCSTGAVNVERRRAEPHRRRPRAWRSVAAASSALGCTAAGRR